MLLADFGLRAVRIPAGKKVTQMLKNMPSKIKKKKYTGSRIKVQPGKLSDVKAGAHEYRQQGTIPKGTGGGKYAGMDFKY